MNAAAKRYRDSKLSAMWQTARDTINSEVGPNSLLVGGYLTDPPGNTFAEKRVGVRAVWRLSKDDKVHGGARLQLVAWMTEDATPRTLDFTYRDELHTGDASILQYVASWPQNTAIYLLWMASCEIARVPSPGPEPVFLKGACRHWFAHDCFTPLPFGMQLEWRRVRSLLLELSTSDQHALGKSMGAANAGGTGGGFEQQVLSLVGGYFAGDPDNASHAIVFCKPYLSEYADLAALT